MEIIFTSFISKNNAKRCEDPYLHANEMLIHYAQWKIFLGICTIFTFSFHHNLLNEHDQHNSD